MQLCHQTSFVDCGEGIKGEDIKEEIKEEESVDDPLSIQGEAASGESENNCRRKRRINSLSVQEIYKLRYGENSTIVDIDIVEHKIETADY